MIITCPHCQTKYQVTFEAIGSAGRKVQCAHCSRAWDQQPFAAEPPALPPANDDEMAAADRLFDAMAEDALDEILMAEADAAAAEARPPATLPAVEVSSESPKPSPDAAEVRKRQLAFSRRQNALSSRLPLARMRRAARATAMVMVAGLGLGGYLGREQIVMRYPDLAGVYEAVGLGVNVVGLDFTELSTLKTLSSGNDVLMVSAQIVGVAPQPRPIPPVVVSLLDETGHPVYEWSVEPRAPNLMAGERATFDTRLSLPPTEAVRVRLSFAGGSVTPTGTIASATPAEAAPTEAAHAAVTEHVAPDAPTAAPADAHGAASDHH